MIAYAKTQKGQGKSVSDDRVLLGNQILNERELMMEILLPFVIAVADGVGGNAGGSAASEYVANRLSSLQELSLEQLKDELSNINSDLLDLAKHSEGCELMATTLTGIVENTDGNILFHIGNTRAYVLQGGYLKQLTEDQTTYNFLYKMGRIEDAEHCNKSEIISCLGGGNQSLYQPSIMDIKSFQTLVITSDGIHDYIDIDSLEFIINNTEMAMDEKVQAIIKKAIESGSKDDLSIVIIDNN